LDFGVDHLADDVGVGETNNESVFGRVVFVLVLGDQLLASIVVGLTLYIASEPVSKVNTLVRLKLYGQLPLLLRYLTWKRLK
jgi:hypothetical protein